MATRQVDTKNINPIINPLLFFQSSKDNLFTKESGKKINNPENSHTAGRSIFIGNFIAVKNFVIHSINATYLDHLFFIITILTHGQYMKPLILFTKKSTCGLNAQ